MQKEYVKVDLFPEVKEKADCIAAVFRYKKLAISCIPSESGLFSLQRSWNKYVKSHKKRAKVYCFVVDKKFVTDQLQYYRECIELSETYLTSAMAMNNLLQNQYQYDEETIMDIMFQDSIRSKILVRKDELAVFEDAIRNNEEVYL